MVRPPHFAPVLALPVRADGKTSHRNGRRIHFRNHGEDLSPANHRGGPRHIAHRIGLKHRPRPTRPPTTSSQIEKVTQPPALKLARSLHPQPRLHHPPAQHRTTSPSGPAPTSTPPFQGTTLYFTVGVSREVLHLAIDNQPPLILATPQPGLYRVSGLSDTPATPPPSIIATESCLHAPALRRLLHPR